MKRSLLAALALVSAIVVAGCAGGAASPIDQTKVTTTSAVLEGKWSSNKGIVDGHNTSVTVWFEIRKEADANWTALFHFSGLPAAENCSDGFLANRPGGGFGSACFSDVAGEQHPYAINTATARSGNTTGFPLNENTKYHYRLCAFEPGGQGVPICIGEQVFTTNGNS
jgi:hypothetical protein